MSIMRKINFRVATSCASFLSLVLTVCANTNSCFLVHQPTPPQNLDKFSKL